jgi:hypothetical protein
MLDEVGQGIVGRLRLFPILWEMLGRSSEVGVWNESGDPMVKRKRAIFENSGEKRASHRCRICGCDGRAQTGTAP